MFFFCLFSTGGVSFLLCYLTSTIYALSLSVRTLFTFSHHTFYFSCFEIYTISFL